MSGSVQSIERAGAIVQLLSAHEEPMALAEISGSLGLAKATAHGLLATMVAVGFVQKDPTTATYVLGAAFDRMPTTPIDPNRLRSAALDHADSLAARTGMAVRVGVLEAGSVRVVHHVFAPGRPARSLDVDSVRPAASSALGRVLLAFGSRAVQQQAVRDELGRGQRRGLEAELDDIRRQGFAAERADLDHTEPGLAVPVRAGGGLVVAAVAISGPDHLLGTDPTRTARAVGQLREVAQVVSAGLAARP